MEVVTARDGVSGDRRNRFCDPSRDRDAAYWLRSWKAVLGPG